MAEYIDREALFRDIESSVVFSVRNAPSAEMRGAHKITERIRCAPTADVVEVKHSEWNVIECDKEKGTVFVECECGAVFKLSLFDFGLCYNYCPNCGTKMDGGAE